MSKVVISNPFDQAFRKEIKKSPNVPKSDYLDNMINNKFPLNSNINISQVSEPSSAESSTLTQMCGIQSEVIDFPEINYITTTTDVSLVPYSQSKKSDIQNALINKINCQTRKGGLKANFNGRHQSHFHGVKSSRSESECMIDYSPSDSDTKRKNRDAAKKSRQRKKDYIEKLEKELDKLRKNEKILQNKLNESEKTIAYLTDIIDRLKENGSINNIIANFID